MEIDGFESRSRHKPNTLCVMPFGQMRLQTIILIFGLLNWGHVYGQLILTEEENNAWINKLKSEKELTVQLKILRERILMDTNIYVNNTGDRLILKTEKQKNKELGLCRPILLVEGYFVTVTNDTDNKTVENLTKELTTDKIKELKLLDEGKAKEMFGPHCWCGIIFLTPANKKATKSLLRYKI